MTLPALRHPIIQAPLAGGPSTPELAAAVSEAGGLGFLAAGYVSPERVAQDLTRYRELSTAPVGVNVFFLADRGVDDQALSAYARDLAPEAERQGAQLGTPRFEDDAFAAKVELLEAERPAVVSFTFGCPPAEVFERLHRAGISAWVTVTEPGEAAIATAAGADALVAQGAEAGGHRATFDDTDGTGEIGLLPLLALIAQRTELPLIAAGGIADGRGVAAALAAGAIAAQLGTAFMRCPEAGTSAPQRDTFTAAAQQPSAARGTRLTRAFTGRRARGIVNHFIEQHDRQAPAAYPHVHHMTSPVRAAARKAGDAEAINLWAGEAYPLAVDAPAGELVHRFSAEARDALDRARARYR